MRYWVFHEEMLASALADLEERRVNEGASREQARQEVLLIASFLTSESAKKLVGGNA